MRIPAVLPLLAAPPLWAVVAAASLIGLLIVAAAVNLGPANDMFDTLTADERRHGATLTRAPGAGLEFVPDGFTCLACFEADALPDSVWCAVCAERVANFPAEPIERGPIA